MRRISALLAASAVALAGAVAVTSAGAAPPTPTMGTLNLTMTGSSITVTGAPPKSGAINVISTVTGEQAGEPMLVHLNPGATFEQVFQAVAAHHGDPNYIDPYGAILFNANANQGTSTAQTTLPPGHYVALDSESNNPQKWPHTEFDIGKNPNPAALPAASATVRAIDFGFRGNKTLHDGQLTRFEDDGFLVHMIVGIKAKNRKGARKITALLRAGRDKKAQKLARGFAFFAGPLSPGGTQQFTLAAKPGTYVLACFMNTQDGREHTRLGMERTIRIRAH